MPTVFYLGAGPPPFGQSAVLEDRRPTRRVVLFLAPTSWSTTPDLTPADIRKGEAMADNEQYPSP
jgi:hypothetical protein